MVHFLTHIGAAVVPARVLGARGMAGILVRGLLAGDVEGLLVHCRPVGVLATAARAEAHMLIAVRSGRSIAGSTGLRLERRAMEHGSPWLLTMASAAEQVLVVVPSPGRLTEDRLLAGCGLLAERAGLPAVAAVDLLLVLLGAVARVGLLAERAGLAAGAAVNLLLVLLRAVARVRLLAERAGLAARAAVDLLLVLLGAVAVAGLLAERAGLAAVAAVDMLLVLDRKSVV